jgi:hypothetical protein
MSCLHPETIYGFLDGELGPAEREELGRHLAGCPKCREAVEARKTVIRAVESLPAFDVPADFARGILGQISSQAAPGKATAFGWLVATAAGFLSFAATIIAAALLTGHSLSRLIPALSRFIWTNIQGLANVLTKTAKYIVIAFRILGQILGEILEGFRVMTSFVGPEFQIAAVCLTIVFLVGAGFLWARKYSVERSHEN